MNIEKNKFNVTHRNIINSYIRRLEIQHYKSISVVDIVNDANIHRGTFYLHFDSKNHLIDEVQDIFLEGLNAHSKNSFAQKDYKYESILLTFSELLKYYKQNKIIFLSFIKNNPEFVSGLKYIFFQNLKKVCNNNELPFSVDLSKKNYLLTYIFSAHLGIVEEWLINDIETNPETIASIIVTLTKKSINL